MHDNYPSVAKACTSHGPGLIAAAIVVVEEKEMNRPVKTRFFAGFAVSGGQSFGLPAGLMGRFPRVWPLRCF